MRLRSRSLWFSLLAGVMVIAWGLGCDGKTKMTIGSDASTGGVLSDTGGTGGAGGTTSIDTVVCDGSAMAGTWYRALDGLIMILAADGCAITGTSDNPSYRHIINGTYDDVALTMVGTIKRTTVSSGCVTIMNATWVLTDPTHFAFAITTTDGQCDLLASYHELNTYVRQ